MDIIIVTGMSGSGKTNVIKALEDIGYFCADNIPPTLFLQFFNLVKNAYHPEKIAVVIDSRLKIGIQRLPENLAILKENGYDYKILFIDADDEVLLRRYKETRRLHPLSAECNHSLTKAISTERELLTDVKARADYIFDTSNMSAMQFNEKIRKTFSDKPDGNVNISCVSFGYKHGMPRDCDLVFDVRCLPNPFYIPDLKAKTGLDKEVRDYVLMHSESMELLKKIIDMIDFSLPLYEKEGKSNLVVGFGCTGGHHRSVTFAEMLAAHLRGKGFNVEVEHKDVNR